MYLSEQESEWRQTGGSAMRHSLAIFLQGLLAWRGWMQMIDFAETEGIA
jgi:hypothetical protein